jgi:ABC-type nitrate/sulfonate/bicarbonate transport system substrate-binding protein
MKTRHLVRVLQFNGPAENILALRSGKLDLMHNPWTTTFAAYAAGSNNLRIVGGSGQAGIELVARCARDGASPSGASEPVQQLSPTLFWRR